MIHKKIIALSMLLALIASGDCRASSSSSDQPVDRGAALPLSPAFYIDAVKDWVNFLVKGTDSEDKECLVISGARYGKGNNVNLTASPLALGLAARAIAAGAKKLSAQRMQDGKLKKSLDTAAEICVRSALDGFFGNKQRFRGIKTWDTSKSSVKKLKVFGLDALSHATTAALGFCLKKGAEKVNPSDFVTDRVINGTKSVWRALLYMPEKWCGKALVDATVAEIAYAVKRNLAHHGGTLLINGANAGISAVMSMISRD